MQALGACHRAFRRGRLRRYAAPRSLIRVSLLGAPKRRLGSAKRSLSSSASGTCTIHDGKGLAKRLLAECKTDVSALPFQPKLCIIQVGDRKDSEAYIKKKMQGAKKCGMLSEHVKLPDTVSEEELLSEIVKRNNDPDTHGIIVQQPVPEHIHVPNIDKTISIVKDVDAFHPYNAGLLMNGLDPSLIPCTALGVMAILDDAGVEIKGKHAVVLGRSQIVGAPTAALLRHRDATVTVVHSRTQDPAAVARTADILIVAMGQMEKVDDSWIKPGAVVVDVGMHYKKVTKDDKTGSGGTIKGHKATGDVLAEPVKRVAGMLTPVPGGVGPLTVASVLRNTISCATLQMRDRGVKLLPLDIQSPVPSDAEISASHAPKNIAALGEELNLAPGELVTHGPYKAKVSLDVVERLREQSPSRYILVTGMTPTKFGEGKSTTLLGLCQAFAHIGKTAFACVRQPSLGPTFGLKGGAAGGGYSQIIPMTEMNMHLTGDFHAITAANNLLAAQVDTRALHEATQSDKSLLKHLAPDPKNLMAHLARRADKMGVRPGADGAFTVEDLVNIVRLSVDSDSLTWRRVLDSSDRHLRRVEIGLNPTEKGLSRVTGFDITAASEIMAILALSTSMQDLSERLSRIVVGNDTHGNPLTADDFGCGGSMAAMLHESLMPTLMQTLEGSPALIHCGPFANIAHGNSSIMADEIALRLAGSDGYVITEAGFGGDMGMEKFFNIKCHNSGRSPDAVVVTATVKAIKMHGVGSSKPKAMAAATPDQIRQGCKNVARHVAIAHTFGVPAIVALNAHINDSPEELQIVADEVESLTGTRPVASHHWARGGEGSIELAQAVEKAADSHRESGAKWRRIYESKDGLKQKMEAIATKVYGGVGVNLSPEAQRKLELFESQGYGDLPICMAKTQYSFSHDPKLLNVPTGFTIDVKDMSLSAGAGFVCAYLGDIQTMPGLPTHPTLMDIGLRLPEGEITGLS